MFLRKRMARVANLWIRGAIVGGSLSFEEAPKEPGAIATGHIELVLGRYDAKWYQTD